MFTGGVGLDHMERLAERLKEFDWYLQLLLNARDLVDLSPRLKKLPVDIVIDHMGYMSVDQGIDHPGFQALLDLIKDGAWVKVSGNYRISKEGPPYQDTIPFAQASSRPLYIVLYGVRTGRILHFSRQCQTTEICWIQLTIGNLTRLNATKFWLLIRQCFTVLKMLCPVNSRWHD